VTAYPPASRRTAPDTSAAARGTARAPRRGRTTGPRGTGARLAAALDAAGEHAVLAVESHDVEVTHLDRVYWPADAAAGTPAFTKRDYLRYLVTVAPALLPALAGRPLTLFRWPTGIGGRRVRQKHWEIPLPAFVTRTHIFSESKGHADEYICCDNLATLVWLGHMGALELHGWHSRITPGPDSPVTSTAFAGSLAALRESIVEYPDYLLFDVDPFVYSGAEAPGRHPERNAAAFELACRAAAWLHGLLDGMGLRALVKTSGRTGLHVAVPICRTLPYDAVREIARLVAGHVQREHPREITLEWSVDKRTGKAFLDYNMNARGKSMPAPWSVRGSAGAPVSMPLDWDELGRVRPESFHLGNAAARLRRHGDAWAGLVAAKQSLEARIQG
jgi:bifunctional non-homologous end joining protein LigD